MNTAYLLTGLGFVVLTVVFFSLLTKYFFRAIAAMSWPAERKSRVRNRLLWALGGWAMFVAAASLSGFTSRFDWFPGNAAPILLVPLVSILLFSLSGTARDLLMHVPASVLATLQVFRIAVEVLLWVLFIQHLLPIQMTFEGRNFDILSGVLGGVVGLFFHKNRLVVLAYNLIGLALLINIVGTALLSMPTPFRVFMQEPANTIVLKFPFIFLPAFLVPLAYGLHFLSLRQGRIQQ
ncbi:MAG: hypothetical protein ACOYXA_13920 [Bacteroidota bacterium]